MSKNKDFCNVVMTSQENIKILEFNQKQKFDETAIY